jgi:NADPH2:quinone reductase
MRVAFMRAVLCDSGKLVFDLERQTMKAIRVHENGGPEVLRTDDIPQPAPAAGQVLIKVHAVGVNFIDIYQRDGLYKLDMPFIAGSEASGVVESVGADVTGLAVGDRVAFGTHRGSYAEYVAVPAALVVKIPDGVTFEQAAAAMLQGMTAHYLTHSTFPLTKDHTCLIHAAAGGAGGLVVQMAKIRGARVIGTTSSEEKVAVAKSNGCDEVIRYDQTDFSVEARRLTGGKGVDVVYDSVGASTFDKSIDSLRPKGMMVSFGNASGPVPPIAPGILGAKGSLFLTRPSLFHYVAERSDLEWRSNDVLGWIAAGRLKVPIGKTYPLGAAQQAHIDLAGRGTTGKLLLIP